MAPVTTKGVVQEPHSCTAYPIATGAIVPPALANVFMQPVTTPAASPPMSWQRAHAELILKSAVPAAAAISNAARIGLRVSAAEARMAPLTINAPAATPQRPIFTPYLC